MIDSAAREWRLSRSAMLMVPRVQSEVAEGVAGEIGEGGHGTRIWS